MVVKVGIYDGGGVSSHIGRNQSVRRLKLTNTIAGGCGRTLRCGPRKLTTHLCGRLDGFIIVFASMKLNLGIEVIFLPRLSFNINFNEFVQ